MYQGAIVPGLTRLLLLAAALCGGIGMLAGCAPQQSDSAPLSDSAISNQTAAPNDQAVAPDSARRTQPMTSTPVPAGKEVATLAGGCFWCTEAIFRELKGVESVEPGYAGGQTPNPSYHQVCTGTTGHAESVQIVFDPTVISFHDLLAIFFTVHDPTTLNRQGADAGTQYRSAIFYHSPEQKQTAEQEIKEITAQHIWPDKIVTEVTAFTNFYPAEEYHYDYFERNPNQGYCQFIIAPKVAKFRAHYQDRLKR
jgi:peptide-methionine (S)-S-oxide reductase